MELIYQNLFNATIILSMFMCIGQFLILFESRYPKKVYLASLIPAMTVWFGGNIAILLIFGLEIYGRYSLITGTLTSLIYFWIVAKNRGGRFFFTFSLVDTVMIWVMLATNLVDYAVGGGGLVAFLLRLVFFPVALFVDWRLVRRPYLQLLHSVSRGWWLFAGMTGLFYLTLSIIGNIPTSLRDRPEDMPIAVMLLLLLPLTYATIFLVLHQQKILYRVRERQHTFEIQSAMIEQRVTELRSAEDRLRYERHDLRHRLLAIAGMLQQNDVSAALDYIGAAQEALHATEVARYCSNPALDAILSSYFRQAADLGIQVEAKIELPDELPVSAADLSTVFANALENMIHAVGKLPLEKRRMVCKCIASPCLMIEFSNPCGKEARLGSDGFPIAKNAGHGTGTRSIAAFAEKYEAVCSFQIENGWFKLRLAL